MIAAGELNTRISIESAGHPTRNAKGETLPAWQQIAVCMASVKSLSARETIRARQVELQTSIIVKLRYFRGLTSAHRITYLDECGSRHVLNITGIVDVGNRHLVHECSCVEVSNG